MAFKTDLWRMFEPYLTFENIERGLDDEALVQHELVSQRHERVAHDAPNAGDQVQAVLLAIPQQPDNAATPHSSKSPTPDQSIVGDVQFPTDGCSGRT